MRGRSALSSGLFVLALAVTATATDPEAPPAAEPAPLTAGAEGLPAQPEPPAQPPPDAPPADAPPASEPPASPEAASSPRAPRAPQRPGGVHPCATPDPGFGAYGTWSRAVSMGQLLAPARGGLTKAGGFDLVVHFHGHEAIRKEVVRAARGVVLVGIDVGVGSGAYASAFSAPHVFEDLLRSVEQEMARRNDRKRAVVRHLALSSWSAGYGAIAQILRQPAGKKVDAVVLLDSLHAGYAGGNALKDADLEPFVAFARRAARGEKLLFQSHSSIVPPGYASTREVSHHVVGKLGGKVREARRSDVLGLELFERFDQRGYHVRGYRGDDKPDHCAHIGLMRDVVRAHLGPRWSPPAMKAPRAAGGERVTAKGRVHVVAPGESLIGIAKRYGLDARGLRERNGLRKGEPIQPGQELLLTGAPSAAAKAKKGGAGAAGKAAGRVHVVAEGQSLRKIARRYRVTVDAIVQANGLKRGEPIHPGQSLVIPERGARPRKPKAGSAERGAPTKAAANDGPRDEKPPAAGGSTATAAHAPADADHDDPGD